MSYVRTSLGFVAALSVAVMFVWAGSTAQEADWLATATPQTQEGTTYARNPGRTNLPCHYKMLLIQGQASQHCIYDSSIGQLDTDGKIVSEGSTYKLTIHSRQGFLDAVPNANDFIETTYASFGAYARRYTHLQRSDLERKVRFGVPMRIEYELTAQPLSQLHDQEGNPLRVTGKPLAMSSNGQWLVYHVWNAGLFRVSSDFSQAMPFAPGDRWDNGIHETYSDFAIDNSGRYVVAADESSLRLFDLSGCTQLTYTNGEKPDFGGCHSREMWRGDGLDKAYPSFSLYGNIRFTDQFSIRLVLRNISSQLYRDIYVTAPGAQLHKMQFLGLGDSYISGEGTMHYRDGTDTNDNKCHLSPDSYPYLIGQKLYDSYESVACSGAAIDDVRNGKEIYQGQALPEVPLGARDPNTQTILQMFSPGYAGQIRFVEEYKPKTSILSIGGNDVGFRDIIQSCVAIGTCYDSYEERRQKLEEIQRMFPMLATTYRDILTSGVQNLYVVGYPSVAKNDGNCGLNVHLNNDEIVFSNMLIDYLNGTIRAAATSAGARYVDISDALVGHRLCENSGDEIAVNGLTVGNDSPVLPVIHRRLGPINNGSYHPNLLGHRLIEQAVMGASSGLSQAMPVADQDIQPPVITDDMAMLKGVSRPENYSAPVLETSTMVDGTLVRGEPTPLHVDGLSNNTQPNTSYKIEIHSTPRVIATVQSDANGDIDTDITIPADIEPGYHAINVYGPSFGGADIQVQQYSYVAASAEDFDGDGIPNLEDSCVIVVASGQDLDEDGIDDACDAVIGDVPDVTSPQSQQPQSNEGGDEKLTPSYHIIQPGLLSLGSAEVGGYISGNAAQASTLLSTVSGLRSVEEGGGTVAGASTQNSAGTHPLAGAAADTVRPAARMSHWAFLLFGEIVLLIGLTRIALHRRA